MVLEDHVFDEDFEHAALVGTTPNVAYTYDANGQRQTMSDGSGQTNSSSGHGLGKPHVPYHQLPSGWGDLPPDVEPMTPIGQ